QRCAHHRDLHSLPTRRSSDLFTINAIAWDPFTQQLIDPFNGRGDLEQRILRHTSGAFVEDPLRVLRAMQFAGRFDLTLAPETAADRKSTRLNSSHVKISYAVF